MPFSSLKAKDLKPYGTRILVKKYTKPEKIGSIYLNPAWLRDNSRALWEVVSYKKCKCKEAEKKLKFQGKSIARCVECYLGFFLPEDTILVTLPNRGVHQVLDEKEEHYFLFAEEIVKIVLWREE